MLMIRSVFVVMALLIATDAAAGGITYLPFSPPTIFNSAIEVLPEVNNSAGFVQGPLSSTLSINTPFTDTISISMPVASTATLGNGSVTAQGLLNMSATVSATSISGQGSVTTSAVLSGGGAGGAGLISDGTADFDINFTITSPTPVTLDFSVASLSSLTNPNNLAVVFLAGPNGDTVLRAEAVGTGSQTAAWTGVLAPGDYFLRGLGSYEDFVTTQFNDGNTYSNSESFAFTVTVPEPGSLTLWLAALVGLALTQRQRMLAWPTGSLQNV
jgi:hypothetical protein